MTKRNYSVRNYSYIDHLNNVEKKGNEREIYIVLNLCTFHVCYISYNLLAF